VTSNGYQKLQIWEAGADTASRQAKVAYIMCQQHVSAGHWRRAQLQHHATILCPQFVCNNP
jgi:hypothetical protein